MIFREEEIPVFLEIFTTSCSKIRNFDGCINLQLMKSQNDKRILFTISEWESEDHLERYRSSELFTATWAKTKILFDAPPEAWTTTPGL